MEIPKFWARAKGDAEAPDGAQRQLIAWGWSTATLEQARDVAQERLLRLLSRVKRGEPLPKGYGYGSRPVREQILEQLPAGNDPAAVLTRNAYGSVVLNTARLLFIDVDEPAGTLDGLRSALRACAPTTFRIYRTAAGFRAMAIDREFSPEASETTALLQRCGADPAFVQLCRVQKSFRARLTPKPWRCEFQVPPGQFPRDAPQERQFEKWLSGYEAACRKYATCKFVETVGSGSTLSGLDSLVRIHDTKTRCQEALPLA
jgi:hypothetical protein